MNVARVCLTALLIVLPLKSCLSQGHKFFVFPRSMAEYERQDAPPEPEMRLIDDHIGDASVAAGKHSNPPYEQVAYDQQATLELLLNNQLDRLKGLRVSPDSMLTVIKYHAAKYAQLVLLYWCRKSGDYYVINVKAIRLDSQGVQGSGSTKLLRRDVFDPTSCRAAVDRAVRQAFGDMRGPSILRRTSRRTRLGTLTTVGLLGASWALDDKLRRRGSIDLTAYRSARTSEEAQAARSRIDREVATRNHLRTARDVCLGLSGLVFAGTLVSFGADIAAPFKAPSVTAISDVQTGKVGLAFSFSF